ncbi:riboflavin kinase [Lachnospiraceae bacterium KM106-2]|nr:riboflavin kinase [Lachnospiraceae bacterium KM106-2]
MKYIADTTEFHFSNSIVTLGKFDGLHKGHQLLINHITKNTNEYLHSVMFTFSLHPSNLFSNSEIKLVYTKEEKIKRLEQLGIDVLIAYPFTKETACQEAEDFIKEILVGKLDAKVIVVGSDYRFGHNRRGNVAMLEKFASVYGYEVFCYDKVLYDGEEISSTRVRKEVKEGNMELVTELLGRPYSFFGKVVHGRQIGRTLGMPTTNLVPGPNKLIPPRGVYASYVLVDGVRYESVTNIGLKPTVGGENKEGVESFIFDFCGDLYGKEIEVMLLKHQRSEKKFESLEALKEQIQSDINETKEYFNKTKSRY